LIWCTHNKDFHYKDPWSNAHRIEVKQDKPDKERGYYLHPDVYDQPEKGISHTFFSPQEGEKKKSGKNSTSQINKKNKHTNSDRL
jgi:hypothetical protein